MIAPPVPAVQSIPDWFKRLPGQDREQLTASNNGLTVKRCLPFLDAMSSGWIMPLAATVRLEISGGGTRVEAGWEFDRVMVSPHGTHQIAGSPFLPRPPMKFHNYWTIRTPPGWSCLVLPALNRPDPVVQLMSGVVDTDRYSAPVNFPFVGIGTDGVHVLERGRPLAQVIPFRRRDLRLAASIESETDGDRRDRRRVQRSVLAGEGWYRREARDPMRTPERSAVSD